MLRQPARILADVFDAPNDTVGQEQDGNPSGAQSEDNDAADFAVLHSEGLHRFPLLRLHRDMILTAQLVELPADRVDIHFGLF